MSEKLILSRPRRVVRWTVLAALQLAILFFFIWIAPLLWHVLSLSTIFGLVKEFIGDHPVFTFLAGLYVGGGLVMFVVFLNFMDGASSRR